MAELCAGDGRSGCNGDRPLTQKLLGWHPTRPGLIEDLDEGHYFQI